MIEFQTYTARVFSRAQTGLQAPEVCVEVHLSGGVPRFNLVGLPETAVRESRERVRSAIITSGYDFPDARITANLAPADLPKQGGRYDLAIALGILIADGQLPEDRVENMEFVAELGLSGDIRPVRRVMTAALAASDVERTLLVAPDDVAEASLVKSLALVTAPNLRELIGRLLDRRCVPVTQSALPAATVDPESGPNLRDVRGQPLAKRALEIAAAGGLNVLFVGSPGSGKTMLATRLPGILPPMTEAEAIETACVYSLDHGGVDAGLWRRRPFRSPHHSASSVALVGGGSRPSPGEISLAHNGVLFLDELAEFTRHALDQLREPIETGGVHIARAQTRVWFPARCQLVAAMNPCPCGWAGEARGRCRCTPDQVDRYMGRVSGPLLDRIDLQLSIPAVPPGELLIPPQQAEESSATVRQRVMAARARQLLLRGCLNRSAIIQSTDTPRVPANLGLDTDARRFLLHASTRLGLSARAQHRVLRVARTIADLDADDAIVEPHVAEAISMRCFDRGNEAGQ